MAAGIGIREILNQNNRLLPEVVRLSASGRVQYIALVNSLSYPLFKCLLCVSGYPKAHCCQWAEVIRLELQFRFVPRFALFICHEIKHGLSIK